MTTKADDPIEPRQASYPRFSTREDINLVPQVAQSGNVKGLKLLALIEELPVAVTCQLLVMLVG